MNDHEANLGKTLGKYRLVRLIGSGGMAAVYEAVHRNANRVALKMLHPHLSVEGELRDRFLREGYMANSVGHRGAVRVLDDDVAPDGSVFLVMELLEGQTVDAVWEERGRRLSPREALEIGHQLLDVLTAAHAGGIVHRDIKPDNLFLTTDGVVKVLDFGIARLRQNSITANQTSTGTLIGTPGYMPPEQALGRSAEIDGRTDLWAVGATLFALVSGQLVHAAETPAELLIFAGCRPARSLAAVAPDAPPAIVELIDRALSFNRDDRFPDARAMNAGLEAAYLATFGVPIPSARATPALLLTTKEPLVPATEQRRPAHPSSTTAAVASPRRATTAREEALALPYRKSGGLVAIALGVAVVVTATGAGVLSLRPHGESTQVGIVVGSPPSASAATDPAPIASATTSTPATSPSLTMAAAPTAAPTGTPSLPRAHATSGASRPSAPPASKKSCNPPYTIDERGHRIPKMECL